MGRRGPPPKPSSMKKLAGTFRKDRAAVNEFEPEAGIPNPPEYVRRDRLALAEWELVVPILINGGVTTSEIDQSALARYCTARSLEETATRLYQDEGIVVAIYKMPRGRPKKKGPPAAPILSGYQPHPAVGIADRARMQANVLGAKFGLTPSDRVRISVDPEAKGRRDKASEAESDLFGKNPPQLSVHDGGKK